MPRMLQNGYGRTTAATGSAALIMYIVSLFGLPEMPPDAAVYLGVGLTGAVSLVTEWLQGLFGNSGGER